MKMKTVEDRRTRIRHLLTALFAGMIFALIVFYSWKMNLNELDRESRANIELTARLISEQLTIGIHENVQTLQNLKRRIEETDGDYFDFWEFEASLILEQSPSFLFVQWIDSSMVIRDVFPVDGNEEAIGLDISSLDYRRSDWLRSARDTTLNLTVWTELVQGGSAFLVDAPVYYDGEFHGTVSAGMDFSSRFDDILQGSEMYHVNLRDESGTLFYEFGSKTGTNRFLDFSVERRLELPVVENSYWYFRIIPNAVFAESAVYQSLQVNLILGLFLSLLLSFMIYFMLGFYSSRRSYSIANKKLRSVIDSSPIAIYVVNKKGIVTNYWNKAAENILGWKAGEVRGQYLPHITKQNPAEYQNMIETVLNGAVFRNKDSERVRKNGSKVYVRLHAGLLKQDKDEPDEIIIMLEDITKQKEAEERLQAQKQFADATLKSLPGLFYLIDENRRLIRWNKNVNDFFGLTNDELRHANFLDFFVEDERMKVLEHLQNATYGGNIELETVVRSQGEPYDFFINGTLMIIGEKRYIVGNGINITERNKIRNELQRSVDEKDVLLSEIHHRVKNNLAIIANLIELRLTDIDNEYIIEILKETQNRIYSIAGVHEMLYGVRNFSKIPFKGYLQKLFERIFELYSDKHSMTSYELKVEVEHLNINQAIPLGLILTELITNSFKHAFKRNKAGTITIEITGGPDNIHVLYKDNGEGFYPEIFETASSMGLILVRSLLEQLKADYTIRGGTGFDLKFSFEKQTKGAHSTFE